MLPTKKIIVTASSVFLVVATVLAQSSNVPCTTPNNEQGSCISLFSCPVLIKSIGSSNSSTIDFVKKSLCGDCKSGDIKVCCGSSGTFFSKPSPPQESHRDFVIRRLLPTRKYCGLQHTDDRFYNSTETALDEFPWLVLIKWYESEDEADFTERCNGVLISNRYVLTDYYCGFDARRVKLGYHTITQNVSCIDDPFIPECTDPALVIDVEEKFRWGIPSKSGEYNFALMRLAEKVTYTDFIRPICLPLDDTIPPPTQLTLSGWGSKGPNAVAKKRLVYNVTSVDRCYKTHAFLQANVVSAKVDLICLAAVTDNKAKGCNGDHGGALMFSYSYQWFVQGILISVFQNLGSDYCSNEHPVNGIALTRNVIEWILSSMHA